MRQAAGILMVAFALFMVRDVSSVLSSMAFLWPFYSLGLGLLLVFLAAAAFIIAGGVFSLQRRYWRVCFASAVVTVLSMILLWINETDSVLAWIVSMMGTFPIVFVLLMKSEWQASQA
jgi:hypothetical protein